jgi:L-seryl-tRNA(Ser) seleniumtransferase
MRLSELPAVYQILEQLSDLAPRFPHRLLADEARAALDRARALLASDPAADPGDIVQQTRDRVLAWERPSLRRVINATGVVLHTNLGRAPLPGDGYSNLEYDLRAGRRGNRDIHAGHLLERLLNAPAIVVNNNAAAVYLALNELAAGAEVIVSRGELIEIGDGFRIPDIMVRSGAILREVGTTNRTRIEDYAGAITERTGLLMIVHPSNFRIQGFTAKPTRQEIVELGRQRGIPVYEDLGSGCLADLKPFGIDEPRAQQSLADGVQIVSFSGDKLLGGPQAGILAGEASYVERLRRNPMFRALRVDKLILAKLEQTLRATLLERWDDIPALRMIRLDPAHLRARAEALAQALGGTVIEGESVIGGGSTPEQTLPAWLVVLHLPSPAATAGRLRQVDPPVVARIENDNLLLDPRTILPTEEQDLIAAVRAAVVVS